MWMVAARHRLTRTFADPLAAPAAHEAAMIEEDLQQGRCHLAVREADAGGVTMI